MNELEKVSSLLEEIKACTTSILTSVSNINNLISLDNLENKIETKPITLEEVRKVLADISRSGKTLEVKELLKKYGANKLSEVNSIHYEALLKDAGELNGK